MKIGLQLLPNTETCTCPAIAEGFRIYDGCTADWGRVIISKDQRNYFLLSRGADGYHSSPWFRVKMKGFNCSSDEASFNSDVISRDQTGIHIN